ncbi:MAG TPA: glycosyltransferase family 4 protein [Anaerolineae bacterium]|nr:glycosyltransferase family 4 protein [Anaerolineae bacterium]HNU05714.1 glycosyltransferase family 4 protein [Anaerolineae bacterium]
MRILYLTHNVTWKGGGAFFHAYHLARHLVRRGHEVTLLTISPKARTGFHQFEAAGVRIVETPDLLPGQGRTGWDPWDVLQRIRFVSNEHYDIVHGLESRPAVALPALWLKITQGTPTILDWADWYGRGGTASERGRIIRTFMQPVETFCEETFYPWADAVVAMGEPLLERAAALGIQRQRMITLLNGCDPEGLTPYSVEEARSRLTTVPRGAFVLGYVGVMRATTAKLLFSALSLIKQMIPQPVKVLCVGNHKLKDFWSFVPADCREDVIETGWIDYDDLNVYLSASDVMVLPFQRMIATDNIWPSKLNDYLAVGRPTVATNMRILRPLFNAYDIGLLTEDTPLAFAQGVVTMLLSPDVRARQSLSARALAEGELSWEHQAGQLEQFYIKLIGSRRA